MHFSVDDHEPDSLSKNKNLFAFYFNVLERDGFSVQGWPSYEPYHSMEERDQYAADKILSQLKVGIGMVP